MFNFILYMYIYTYIFCTKNMFEFGIIGAIVILKNKYVYIRRKWKYNLKRTLVLTIMCIFQKIQIEI